MRIICPSCEAAYDIPPAVLTAGRKLRCARCHRDWMPAIPAAPPPEPPAAAPPPQAPAPLPPVRVPDMPLPRIDMRPGAGTVQSLAPDPGPSPALIGAAWLASFAVLAALGWGLVHERQRVMRLWPASSWVYRAAGLEQ